MQKSDDLRTTGLKSSLAAVISGTVSKVMHPLEVLKIRFQSLVKNTK